MVRASAVGVTNEDSGAAHPPEGAFCHGDVLFAVIEAILGGDYFSKVIPSLQAEGHDESG